jgi:hypothetical protein
MKKYLIEFTHGNGETEIVELTTDRIEWSIEQWCRNRHIIKHKVLEEGSTSDNKRMLFG